MMFIRMTTAIPVPFVHHVETAHNNAIGFPCIIMECMPDRAAYHLFPTTKEEVMHCGDPTLDMEQIRQNFVEDLAFYQVEHPVFQTSKADPFNT